MWGYLIILVAVSGVVWFAIRALKQSRGVGYPKQRKGGGGGGWRFPWEDDKPENEE